MIFARIFRCLLRGVIIGLVIKPFAICVFVFWWQLLDWPSEPRTRRAQFEFGRAALRGTHRVETNVRNRLVRSDEKMIV